MRSTFAAVKFIENFENMTEISYEYADTVKQSWPDLPLHLRRKFKREYLACMKDYDPQKFKFSNKTEQAEYEHQEWRDMWNFINGEKL